MTLKIPRYVKKHMVNRLKSLCFGYEFVEHKEYKDYVKTKGLLSRKKVFEIKKEDMKWDSTEMEFKSFSNPIFYEPMNLGKVYFKIYFHVDHENRIILYRF